MANFLSRVLRILADALLDAFSSDSGRASGRSKTHPRGGGGGARGSGAHSGGARNGEARSGGARSGDAPKPAPARGQAPAATGSPGGQVRELRQLPRFQYAPQRDGDADPGEVVWAWVPFEDDPTQGKDRPVLVLGRVGSQLAVVTLTSKDHGRGGGQRGNRVYVDVGTGAWDPQGRPSEARVDRVIALDPQAVRREGASLDRATFEHVAHAVASLH
ncbi:type II toxin-antitoxin system PemK/MazF family toxin [Buchananella felis]|uniref:type II toxin-antitoxin system PemK/MazF family toxin n=1 Tax=Buchananella felis TaxID=3231492 RepID=UPI0035275899